MASERAENSRKMPRQARARATVDAILMAAAHLLRTEGRDRATTNWIAERAGVSIGSLFQYFPNKEAIWARLREGHDASFAREVQERNERAEHRGFRQVLSTASFCSGSAGLNLRPISWH
jgi:AcrR family transcriptional regulator